MSWGRPTARLFRISASLLSTKTGKPSSSVDIRVLNASATVTPEILVSRSIRVQRATKLNHLFRNSEIGFCQISFGKAEIAKKGNELGCIIRRGPDQNVEVAGVTRPSVKGETERADDYVLNAAGV